MLGVGSLHEHPGVITQPQARREARGETAALRVRLEDLGLEMIMDQLVYGGGESRPWGPLSRRARWDGEGMGHLVIVSVILSPGQRNIAGKKSQGKNTSARQPAV